MLRRVGWIKQKKKYTLQVDGHSESSGLIAASNALPRGTYNVRTANQCLVPSDVAYILAAERGLGLLIVDPEPEPPPPPPPPSVSGTGVIAVLAHVDHGKTTLLDALLGSNVAANESGGITQCVRPSLLHLNDNPTAEISCTEDGATPGSQGQASPAAVRTLAFVDTPGHGVFVGMRSAAADSADLALILVALDAGIQPQTREVIRRCAERSQPVAFALTKADIYAATHEEALMKPHVVKQAEELRDLWEAEQQRAARLQLRSGGREEPPDQSGAEPGPQLSSVSVSVLCAPRGWGLDELLLTLRTKLSAIGHGCVGNGINDDAVSESTVGVGNDDADGGVVDGVGAVVQRESAPPDEAIGLILETASTKGLGTTLLTVVRSGTIGAGMHIVCGSVSGRVRTLRVASGTPSSTMHGHKAADDRAFLPADSATIGQSARLVIAWDDRESFGYGGFGVGDIVRAWPASAKEAAIALAAYRSAVELLLEQRQPLETDLRAAAEAEAAAMLGDQQATRGMADGEENDDYYYYVEDGVDDGDGCTPECTGGHAASQLTSDVLVNEHDDDDGDHDGTIARGAACVIKAQSAGELQAMLDFLKGRKARSPGGEDRLVVMAAGVGPVRDEELIIAQDALKQRVPCAVYALSLKMSPERHRAAQRMNVRIKEYDVFHELLTDLLHSAGLPGPARELADMADDGSTKK